MKPYKISLIILSSLILLTFLLISSCSKKSDSAEIKIGAILPLTGDGAKYGQSAKRGIDLALEEINTSGGIKGKKVRLIYEDSAMDPKQGVNAVRKLITNDKVTAIIGEMASSVTLAIAPIAEENHTILLSPASSAPGISNAGDYVFRNTYSDTYEGPIMAQYAYQELGLKKASILHINNDFGIGLSGTFRKAFEKIGGKVLLIEAYEQGSSDFKSQLNKINESDTNAIYIVGYSEMGLLLRQAYEMGIKKQVLSCIMFEDPKILEVAKDAAEGVIYTYPAYDSGSKQEDVNNFVQAFKRKYNESPDIYAASSYDALKILVKAIKMGGIESSRIRDALYSIKEYPGVTGLTTFDKNGDVEKPVGIKKVKNGQFIWLKTAL